MSTDGEMNCISIKPDNAPLEVSEKVEIVKGPKELPESVIQAYAKATGQPVIRLQELARRGLMGDLVQRLGASRQGSWMLLESEDKILNGMKAIDDMMGDYAHDPKAIATLVKARLGYVDLWIKVAIGHIESKRDGPEDSGQTPQNIPPPPLVPVQILISGNNVSTSENLK